MKEEDRKEKCKKCQKIEEEERNANTQPMTAATIKPQTSAAKAVKGKWYEDINKEKVRKFMLDQKIKKVS